MARQWWLNVYGDVANGYSTQEAALHACHHIGEAPPTVMVVEVDPLAQACDSKPPRDASGDRWPTLLDYYAMHAPNPTGVWLAKCRESLGAEYDPVALRVAWAWEYAHEMVTQRAVPRGSRMDKGGRT